MQVLDHGIEIEALEFLGVVERFAHRIGQGRVPVENLKVQLVRPPVSVVHDRALAGALVGLCVHVFSPSCSVISSSCGGRMGILRGSNLKTTDPEQGRQPDRGASGQIRSTGTLEEN
jgi:hypothetical protein